MDQERGVPSSTTCLHCVTKVCKGMLRINRLILTHCSLIISLFWLGWTAWPESVGPIVPMISGLFFGIGFQLIFISIINYVTDIYRDLSASAHSAASMTRSIGAVLLPLAAGPMYNELGIHWAPSLLGFIALFMGVIPFVFIKYGDRMIKKSQKNRDVV